MLLVLVILKFLAITVAVLLGFGTVLAGIVAVHLRKHGVKWDRDHGDARSVRS